MYVCVCVCAYIFLCASDNKGMGLIVSCIVAPAITNAAKNKPTEPICVRIGSPILKNHLPSMDSFDPDNVGGCSNDFPVEP